MGSRTAGSGASRPLPFVSAKIPCLITQRTFSQSSRNGSSCPNAVVEGATGGRSHSNVLWTALDKTESGLTGRERNVVGHHRLGETFQREGGPQNVGTLPFSATLT